MKKVKLLAVTLILILALAVPVSAAACIALQATITASSEFNEDYAPHAAVHENVAEHTVGTEWASAGEANPWVRFEWAEAVWIDRIIVADRANLVDWAQIVTITFSDGSSLVTGELENDGYAYTLDFEPKNVTWLQMDITESEGPNIGLGRISIYAADPPPAPAEPEPAPAAEPAPAVPAPAVTAPTPAPRTADPITLIAISSVISAAGIIIAKKRK